MEYTTFAKKNRITEEKEGNMQADDDIDHINKLISQMEKEETKKSETKKVNFNQSLTNEHEKDSDFSVNKPHKMECIENKNFTENLKYLERIIFFPCLIKGEKIGQGGFSKVYLEEYHNFKLAKKKFKFFLFNNFLNEVNLINKLRHANIPRFFGCYLENTEDILKKIEEDMSSKDSSKMNSQSSLNHLSSGLFHNIKSNINNESKVTRSSFFSRVENDKLNNVFEYNKMQSMLSENSMKQLNYIEDSIKYIHGNDSENFKNFSSKRGIEVLEEPDTTNGTTFSELSKSRETNTRIFQMLNHSSSGVSSNPSNKNNENSNLIKIINQNKDSIQISLLSEYIDGTNLDKYLGKINSDLLKILLMCDLARTMSYLHGMNLIHRDLKPNNLILETSTFSLKILDFGISKMTDRTRTTTMLKGTVCYMAPENFSSYSDSYKKTSNSKSEEESNEYIKSSINKKVDVWAFGCILNETFGQFNMKPWNCNENDNLIMAKLISKIDFPVSKGITNIFIRSMIKDCTNLDPLQRPNFSQILKSLIFALKEKLKEFSSGDELIDDIANGISGGLSPKTKLLIASRIIHYATSIYIDEEYLDIHNSVGKIYEKEQNSIENEIIDEEQSEYKEEIEDLESDRDELGEMFYDEEKGREYNESNEDFLSDYPKQNYQNINQEFKRNYSDNDDKEEE